MVFDTSPFDFIRELKSKGKTLDYKSKIKSQEIVWKKKVYNVIKKKCYFDEDSYAMQAVVNFFNMLDRYLVGISDATLDGDPRIIHVRFSDQVKM